MCLEWFDFFLPTQRFSLLYLFTGQLQSKEYVSFANKRRKDERVNFDVGKSEAFNSSPWWWKRTHTIFEISTNERFTYRTGRRSTKHKTKANGKFIYFLLDNFTCAPFKLTQCNLPFKQNKKNKEMSDNAGSHIVGRWFMLRHWNVSRCWHGGENNSWTRCSSKFFYSSSCEYFFR